MYFQSHTGISVADLTAALEVGNTWVLQQPAWCWHQTDVSCKVKVKSWAHPKLHHCLVKAVPMKASRTTSLGHFKIKVVFGLLGMLIQETDRPRAQINCRQGWFNMPKKWWKKRVFSPYPTVISQSCAIHIKSSPLDPETKTERC